MRIRVTSLLAAVFLGLMGCSDASVRFPVTADSQKRVPENVEIIRIDETTISQFMQKSTPVGPTSLPRAGNGEYLIGPDDEISIHVFEHPELNIATGEGQSAASFRVRKDGTFEYPYVGSVKAAGRTLDTVRTDIKARLSKFIPDPQIDVRIAEFKSVKIVVGGAVRTPNTQFITTSPITLLEAINIAGGLLPEADSQAILVRRKGANYLVNLDAFLIGTVSQNNPILAGGDVVSIPKKRKLEAYLFGEVVTPAAIDLSTDTVSLTQALATQGGINEARADARGVFVFRKSNGRFRVFQLDIRLATSLVLGTAFVIEPADVIYVTKSPLQRWNDTITRVLPTASAVGTAKTLGE